MENEAKYKIVRTEILGEAGEEGEEEEDEKSSSYDSENGSDTGEVQQDSLIPQDAIQAQQQMQIIDETNQDLSAFRKTVYLTIMSSLNFEEACHKLLRIELQPGQDVSLILRVVWECFINFFFQDLNFFFLPLYRRNYAT